MQAYICHYSQHWYTIRKLGTQWFNLDSTFKKPKLLSDTYLEMFLAQLQSDGKFWRCDNIDSWIYPRINSQFLCTGHTIFIVLGDLPSCPADDRLTACPVIEETGRRLVDVINVDEDDEDEKNFKLALQMSLKEAGLSSNCDQGRQQRWIYSIGRHKIEKFHLFFQFLGSGTVDLDEIRRKRLQHFVRWNLPPKNAKIMSINRFSFFVIALINFVHVFQSFC